MEKAKTLEQLRADQERTEKELEQETHKLQRLENRKRYYEYGIPPVSIYDYMTSNSEKS